MKVYIEFKVHQCIDEFYDYALKHHVALDDVTVVHKIERLYAAIDALGSYPYIYPLARLKQEWIDQEYREFICEDFHFAYQIYTLPDNTMIVRIHDACHSLLYI